MLYHTSPIMIVNSLNSIPGKQEGSGPAESRRTSGQTSGGREERRKRSGFTLEAGICELHG